MYKANAETHQDCRSLLQKAVRRGNSNLVAKVVNHLYEIGDIRWLKQRLGVITVEECWPLLAEWELPNKQEAMVDVLSQVARSVKFKDAAGLGSLAYALSEGDTSVLSGSDEDEHIRRISDAIKEANKYWKWVIAECTNDHEAKLIQRAEKVYRKGGWPWDRAFTQAAAYLAVADGLPKPQTVEKPNDRTQFPFWVALDKHTPQGKTVLREVANKTRIPWRQLNWVSFYFQSAIVNKLAPSRWWKKETEWRLGKIGLSFHEAESIWAKAQPLFVELLHHESVRLEQHLGNSMPYQMELF
jgi:hypothetical protein